MVKFLRKTTGIAAVVLVASLVLAACGEDISRVSVDLYGWIDDGSETGQFVEGLPDFAGAEQVRVRVTEPDSRTVIEEQTVSVSAGGTTLPDLESGSGLRMEFEVLGAAGVIATGATPTFTFGGEAGVHRGYRVMVSEINEFAPVASVLRIGGEDTLVRSTFDRRQLDADWLGRVGHTAHPTSTGEILIVGGAQISGAFEPAARPEINEVYGDIQLFDPATGYFTELAGDAAALDSAAVGADRLEEPRAFHTVTPLGNDRFLVIGGFRMVGEAQRATGSVEYIDLNNPAGSRVQRVPGLELNSARAMHTATLRSSDGTIVVAGGMGSDDGDIRNTVEIVDPQQSSVQSGLSMSSPRLGHSAVTLEDGHTVWIIGGHDGTQVLDSTDIVPGNSVESGLQLSRARYAPSVVHLGSAGNNLVAVIGGLTGMSSGATASYELGNPLSTSTMATGNWSIDQARGGADIVFLPQSRHLLVFGGFDADRNALKSAERLSIRADRLPPLGVDSTMGEMLVTRSGAASTLVSNGRVIVVGGKADSGAEHNDAEYFNPYDPVR